MLHTLAILKMQRARPASPDGILKGMAPMSKGCHAGDLGLSKVRALFHPHRTRLWTSEPCLKKSTSASGIEVTPRGRRARLVWRSLKLTQIRERLGP